MQDEWKLAHAGRQGYVDAIAELADFRKVNGASEPVWRGLSTAEKYLKKGMKNCLKDDEVAMDQRTRYWRFRGKGALGHAGRAFRGGGELLAALRERA